MKLAYLTSRYPALSHTFILREVLALRECGIDVHTFSVRRTDAGALYTLAEKEEGERTFAILPTTAWKLLCAHAVMISAAPKNYFRALRMAWRCRPPGTRSAMWHLFYFAEAAILAVEIRRRGIEHLHAHFANVASTVAMLASQMVAGTWSMTLHGLGDFGNPRVDHLGDKIQQASFTVCVSEFGRAQAMVNSPPACWSRIHVVRCGLDPDAFAPRPPDDKSPVSRPIRVLTVGRLAPEKGQTILLQAIRDLIESGLDVHCTIVGDGPERAHLEQLALRLGIDQRITFTGPVGQDRIAAFYDAAAVFVLPSLAEGLPVVLMEAMAKRLPVVATRIMGIPELVEDGVHGLLVPPGRPEPLAAAIAKLAADGNLRSRMGSEGRARIEKEFDVRLAARRLTPLFADALARPAGPSALARAAAPSPTASG